MRVTIKRLELSDFGPFEGVKVLEFDGPGTYAICAPNGSGKSHILQAIRMTASPGCQTDKPLGAYVNGYGLKASAAKIIATYDVGGEELEVSRTIALGKVPPEEELRELLRKGDVPKGSSRWSVRFRGNTIKKAEEVTELLSGLFGLENRIQEDAVFVQQNRAGEILRAVPSARSKELQFLSGAEVCQKAADVAQRKLSTIRVVDRSGELNEKQEKLRNLQDLVAGNQALVEELTGLLLPETSVEEMKARLQESNTAKAQGAEYPVLKTELAAKLKDVQRVTSEITAQGMELAVKEKLLDEKKHDLSAAESMLASQTANMEIERQRKILLEKINWLDAQPAAHPAPVEPSTKREDIGECEKILADLTVALDGSQRFLHTFGKDGTCPTCGSHPDNVGELVKKHKATVAECTQPKKEAEDTLRALRKAWSDYDKASATFATWQETWLAQVDETARQLEGMAASTGTDAEAIANSRGVIAECKQLREEAEKAKRAIATLEASLSGTQAEIRILESRCASVAETSLKVLPLDAAEKMTDMLKTNDEVKEQLATQRGELKARQEQQVSLEKDVAALEESQSKIAKSLEVVQFLEGIKSIMHHAAIPHDRSIVYLESVNRIMNSYCETIRAPFRLYVDPDTQNFMAEINDNVCVASQGLSGGQQTLAAWAWHLSLYEKHGNQTGFIVMDEPTVGLDDANLINVGEAVRHLTRYCCGSGIQFIMVTHEANLAFVFNKVI